MVNIQISNTKEFHQDTKFIANPGLEFAKAHGNTGRLCFRGSSCIISRCTFLHFSDQQDHSPHHQQDHSPHHQGGTNNNEHRGRNEGHQPPGYANGSGQRGGTEHRGRGHYDGYQPYARGFGQRGATDYRGRGRGFFRNEVDRSTLIFSPAARAALEEAVDSEYHPEHVPHVQEGLLCQELSRSFLAALLFFMKHRNEYFQCEKDLASFLANVATWITSLNEDNIKNLLARALDSFGAVLVLSLPCIRLSGAIFSVAEATVTSCSATSNNVTTAAELTEAITAARAREGRQHSEPQRRGNSAPDYVDDGEDFTKISAICVDDDFNGNRLREDIQYSLGAIIVDRPVAEPQLHVKQQFRLYREDYLASVRSAVSIIRQCVAPNSALQHGFLRGNVVHEMREMDTKRDMRLYESLKCTTVGVHKTAGVVFYFQMDMQQFRNRRVNWDKRLMTGNLVLMSSTYFQKGSHILVGTVQRQEERRANRTVQQPFNGSFGVCFFDSASFLESQEAETRYCMIESTAFFVPYYRVLTALQQWSNAIPLCKGLMTGDTVGYPRYLQNSPLLDVGSCIKLIDNEKNYNIFANNLERRLEPWSVELEKTLSNSKLMHAVDATQGMALSHIFSHTTAIVQGTPGTGKTFIGAKFAQILLKNFERLKCGPILCICFTNHAIDAFLTDILQYETKENIVRLGAMSKDANIAELGLQKKCHMYTRQNTSLFDDEFLRLQTQLRHLRGPEVTDTVLELLRSTIEPEDPSWSHFFNQLDSKRVKMESETQELANLMMKLEKRRAHLNTIVTRSSILNEAALNLKVQKCEGETLLWNKIREEIKESCRSMPEATPQEYCDHLAQQVKELQREQEKAMENKKKFISDRKARINRKEQRMSRKQQDASEAPLSIDITQNVDEDQLAELENDIVERRNFLTAVNEDHRRLVKLLQDEVRSATKVRHIHIDAATRDALRSCFTELKQISTAVVELELRSNRLRAILKNCVLQQWRVAKGISQNNIEEPNATATTELPKVDEDEDDEYAAHQREMALDARGVGDEEGEEPQCEFETDEHSPETSKQRLRTLVPMLQREDQLTADERENVVQILLGCARRNVQLCLKKLLQRVISEKQKSQDLYDQQVLRALQKHRLIGATTAGCANLLNVMRKLQPKIVIVEEAAEVLECHILACLTPNVEHLILVGDHKQLQPKLEEEMILGRKKNLNISLMERLVRTGAPYVTLTTQRRMHPTISQFTKDYYLRIVGDGDQSVTVLDHEGTTRKPLPLAVANQARVLFVTHDGQDAKAEQLMEGLKSTYNRYETELSLAVADHLLRTNSDASVTILVPYVAQVKHTLEEARRLRISYLSKVCSTGVRIISIDDYQGEESDFIVLCLTRTTSNGFLRGFLNRENRVCVALSRARRGMYIIGCESALQSSENLIFKEMLQILRRDKLIVTTFPAACGQHGEDMPFATWNEYKTARCSRMCGAILPDCDHHCPGVCHEGSLHATCDKVCDRHGDQCLPKRVCAHPCTKLCSAKCGPCEVVIDVHCSTCESTMKLPCDTAPGGVVTFCNSKITKLSSCGHELSATCAEWVNGEARKRCKEPCGQKMPCTHECRRQCHEDDEEHLAATLECKQLKKVLHPRCLHPVEVLCPTALDQLPKCRYPCDAKAPCGHNCEGKCSECHTKNIHRCGRKSTRQLPCGHIQEVLCADKYPLCSVPCTFPLSCGHTCPGTCGECRGAGSFVDHKHCKSNCGKNLLCGHVCSGSCSGECPPCNVPCEFYCGHGTGCAKASEKNKHKCGECRLSHCQNDCKWKCDHQKCTLRCFEPCDRNVCDEHCSLIKIRQCGHHDACMGVCGEVCPEFCRSCFRDARSNHREYQPRNRFVSLGVFLMDEEVDEFLLGELDLSAEAPIVQQPTALRLVELICCGKTMLAGELDGQIEVTTNSAQVVPICCPLCRKVLCAEHYRRQSRRIKQRQQDILSIRAKCLEECKLRADKKESLMNDLEDVAISILPDTIGVTVRQLLDALDDGPWEYCPQKPAMGKENQNYQKSMKKYEQKKTKYEECVKMRNDMKSHIEETSRRAVHKHINERLAMASIRLLMGAKSECVDFSNRDALIFFQCQVQLSQVCLNYFAGKVREHDQFFSTCAIFHDKCSSSDAKRQVSLSMLYRLDQRCSNLLRVVAESSQAVDVGSPPNIPRRVPYEVHAKLLHDLQEQARQTVQGNAFFLRGAGRLGFIENACLPSACSAYQRFANTVKPGDTYRIVYHGTSANAVPTILCRGFDVKRRSGQSLGPGEYFAAQPETSQGYAHNSGMMLVCAIVDQQHTSQGIFVVNNPVHQPELAFVIPLGVAVFQSTAAAAVPHRCSNPQVCPPSLQAVHDAVRVLIRRHEEGQNTDPSRVQQLDSELAKCEKVLSVTRPTREFLSMLTSVLGVTAGHWFKCSKGHFYVIADCGGAMETSRCPDCGEVVGGGSHRVVSTSTSAASDVTQGAQSAWPNQ